MNSVWQLQDAKNKFSQLIKEATGQGPQIITKHGVEVAIVLSAADYRKLLVSRKNLADFFHESPLADVELDLTRDESPVREALDL